MQGNMYWGIICHNQITDIVRYNFFLSQKINYEKVWYIMFENNVLLKAKQTPRSDFM